jgi:hypothetical protein
MRCPLPCLLLLWAPLAAAAADPCTNGSFEQLDASGFPVDWGPVGEGVTVTQDAHQGARALRLARTPETQSAETGLNRGWRPDTGTAMIDRLSGGIDFYYKAISDKTPMDLCATGSASAAVRKITCHRSHLCATGSASAAVRKISHPTRHHNRFALAEPVAQRSGEEYLCGTPSGPQRC